jgi:hypothetical protein
MKKHILHKTLKNKLKPIELKEKKEHKLEKEENNSKAKEEKEENNQEPEKNSSFHETILEESIDFPKPAIREIEEKEEPENLEETVSKESQTIPSNNTNPASPKTTTNLPYQTGLTNTSYGAFNPNQANSSNYDPTRGMQGATQPSLNVRDRNKVLGAHSLNENMIANPSDDFQTVQDKYKDEREKDNTGLPFQNRRRHHGIW